MDYCKVEKTDEDTNILFSQISKQTETVCVSTFVVAPPQRATPLWCLGECEEKLTGSLIGPSSGDHVMPLLIDSPGIS